MSCRSTKASPSKTHLTQLTFRSVHRCFTPQKLLKGLVVWFCWKSHLWDIVFFTCLSISANVWSNPSGSKMGSARQDIIWKRQQDIEGSNVSIAKFWLEGRSHLNTGVICFDNLCEAALKRDLSEWILLDAYFRRDIDAILKIWSYSEIIKQSKLLHTQSCSEDVKCVQYRHRKREK